jgi:N-acetylglucosaminyl-diphospho-decaprenol L-rhamnosyltransferase
MSPIVSVIIVSFNTRKMTIEALHSLINQTCAPLQIIVVDNMSTDDSVQAIEKNFPAVTLLKLEQNIGFAKANNLAAAYAIADYILFLNPDTVVKDHAVDRLLDFAKIHPNAKIWGGRTLFGDGQLNPGSCWSRQTFWSLLCQAFGLSSLFRDSSLFNSEGIGGWDRVGVRSVDIVSGCFLLIERDFWDQLHGFHSDFFMYGEEADLCLRAKQLGARPMVTSDATIVHYGGASERVPADKLVRLLKAKQLLIDRHFPYGTANLGRIMLAFWPISRFFAYSVFTFLGFKQTLRHRNKWGEVVYRYREWFW